MRLEVLEHALHLVSGLLSEWCSAEPEDLGIEALEVREKGLFFSRLGAELCAEIGTVLLRDAHMGFESCIDSVDALS